MARRPDQNSRPSTSRSSPKGATTKSRSSRSNNSQGGGLGGIPGWLWAIAGLIAGFALSQYLDRSSPEPVAAVVPRPTSNQAASGGGSSAQNGGAGAGENTAQPPATPTFEFYTLLPETEVIAPNSDSSAPEPTAKTTQEAAADDAANQTKQPTPSGGRYVLQAASFRDLGDAERLANRLKDFGLLAKITDVRANGDQLWHRVQVGPYEDKRELSRAQDLMVTQGIEPLLLRLQN
ncbi:SPOR domain-containing protein [Salinicola socius]|uniref:Sporulation-like protein n=1 Tax=Salinicola socius TaxID=404433 RepID=A0A1Q8SX38_9GAMM|nr:SPOR domain-containing protein [Salinicola socius]OLO05970.1 sporulation-like protein [Salinicola socius]